MLLLYILWDDWPILMISRSNEQQQQQLEYTLLKPDCHSWWISKMQTGREDTLEERYIIKFCFKRGKMPHKRMECFKQLLEHLAWIKHQFLRFKEDRESVRDDEWCGRSKEINRPELTGQTVRVRITMLRFKGSSGRDSVGRGQHSSNQVSGISTRTMHQFTTPD